MHQYLYLYLYKGEAAAAAAPDLSWALTSLIDLEPVTSTEFPPKALLEMARAEQEPPPKAAAAQVSGAHIYIYLSLIHI